MAICLCFLASGDYFGNDFPGGDLTFDSGKVRLHGRVAKGHCEIRKTGEMSQKRFSVSGTWKGSLSDETAICEVNFKGCPVLECSDEAALQVLSDFVLKKSLKIPNRVKVYRNVPASVVPRTCKSRENPNTQ